MVSGWAVAGAQGELPTCTKLFLQAHRPGRVWTRIQTRQSSLTFSLCRCRTPDSARGAHGKAGGFGAEAGPPDSWPGLHGSPDSCGASKPEWQDPKPGQAIPLLSLHPPQPSRVEEGEVTSGGWQQGLQNNLNAATNNHNSHCALNPRTGTGHPYLGTAAEGGESTGSPLIPQRLSSLSFLQAPASLNRTATGIPLKPMPRSDPVLPNSE